MGKSGSIITMEIIKGAAFYHGLAGIIEDEGACSALFGILFLNSLLKFFLVCFMTAFILSSLINCVTYTAKIVCFCKHDKIFISLLLYFGAAVEKFE